MEKFSSNPICKKCHNSSTTIMFREECNDYYANKEIIKEHLIVTCNKCGYAWWMKTADKDKE